jgi:hypothetical protein
MSQICINLPLKWGHLSIQNTSPDPQGVHNIRVPLYTKFHADLKRINQSSHYSHVTTLRCSPNRLTCRKYQRVKKCFDCKAYFSIPGIALHSRVNSQEITPHAIIAVRPWSTDSKVCVLWIGVSTNSRHCYYKVTLNREILFFQNQNISNVF